MANHVDQMVGQAVDLLMDAKAVLERRWKLSQKRADKWEYPTKLLHQLQLETEEGTEDAAQVDQWLDRIGGIQSRADRQASNLKRRITALRKAIVEAEDCQENLEADRRYAENVRKKRRQSLLERMARA